MDSTVILSLDRHDIFFAALQGSCYLGLAHKSESGSALTLVPVGLVRDILQTQKLRATHRDTRTEMGMTELMCLSKKLPPDTKINQQAGRCK